MLRNGDIKKQRIEENQNPTEDENDDPDVINVTVRLEQGILCTKL